MDFQLAILTTMLLSRDNGISEEVKADKFNYINPKCKANNDSKLKHEKIFFNEKTNFFCLYTS